MKPAVATAAIVTLALALGGCSSQTPEPNVTTTVTQTATETPTPTAPETTASATPSPEPKDEDGLDFQFTEDGKIAAPRINGSTDLPARADLTKAQRKKLEAWTVATSRHLNDMGDLTDKQIVKIAREVCDNLDKTPGDITIAKSWAILQLVKLDAGNADDAHFTIGIAATRSMCTEHADVDWTQDD